MKQGEIGFDNVSMSTFGQFIVFRSVGRGGKLGYAGEGQKISQCYEFFIIIGKESSDFGVEFVFGEGFESDKGFFDIRFEFERVELSVAGVVVNNYKIIFEVVNGWYG